MSPEEIDAQQEAVDRQRAADHERRARCFRTVLRIQARGALLLVAAVILTQRFGSTGLAVVSLAAAIAPWGDE